METMKLIFGVFGLLYKLEGLPVSHSKAIRASSRFTYLGRFSNKVHHLHEDYREKRNSDSSGTQESFYFPSQNAAGWNTAEKDCKDFLGSTAALLCIETQEELGKVARFLESSDDTGAMYWIGGAYDPVRDRFVCGENGTEIGPWAPWKEGHPDTRLPVTRVAITTTGGVEFITLFSTVSVRYICELKA